MSGEIPEWASNLDRIRREVAVMVKGRETWPTGDPPGSGYSLPLEEARFLLSEIDRLVAVPGGANVVGIEDGQYIVLCNDCEVGWGHPTRREADENVVSHNSEFHY